MPDTVEMPRSEVETIAKILGDNSAAACALKDADARIANGENPAFYRVGDTLLVGPRLSEKPDDLA